MSISDRFKDLAWFPKKDTYCIVGGAGGISSWLSLFLTRAGFIPMIYDFDIIEEHNIGGQFYPVNSVGKYKVDSLSASIMMYTGRTVQTINQKFDLRSMGHEYMFSGFDNMQARTDMFHVWKQYVNTFPAENKKQCIFIDGRLQAERLQIFCIQGDNLVAMEEYETKYLFPDADVEDEPCTMKQTTHTAAIIAGFMVSFFTNFLSNLNTPVAIRTVPKYFDVSLPLTFEKIVL